MANHIGRRKFLATLGGAAAAWPLAARAQQPGKMPRVGYIRAGAPRNDPFREELVRGMRDLGYVEGRNIASVTVGVETGMSLYGCNSSTWGRKLRRNVVSRCLGVVAPVVILAGTSAAVAQSQNDLNRMFGIPQRASVQAATRSEWNKISPSEIRCLSDVLRERGASIETLTQRGVKPSDARIGSIRSSCRSQLGQTPSVPT